MALDVFLLKKPYEISFTGNPMPFSFTLSPYRDIEKAQDIRLQVRVLIEFAFGSGVFQEVKSQNFYPNAEGQIDLDTRTIIDPYLDFYLPDPGLQKAVQAVGHRARYKISYLLQKDGAVVGVVRESPILYAIKGGMAYQEWHSSEFFSQVIIGLKKPLNFIAENEKVGVDEKRFLYWLYPYDNSSLQNITFTIKLNNGNDLVLLIDSDGSFIVNSDGSYMVLKDLSLIRYDVPDKIAGGKWSVFCMPAGFNQAGLNGLVPAGLYPIQYSISISAGSIPVVAPVTFSIDHRNFYKTYQIIYRNSVGSLETIRLRGQVDFEADYTMQQAQRIVPPSYFNNMTVLSQSIQDDNEETTKFTGDTGFISPAAADRLRDLFLSPERYEVRKGKLIPVVLNNKNVKFFSNKDNLISVQIQWSWAFSNSFYTPEDLMPVVRSCPAMENLIVQQVSKNILQIMYSLVSPYEVAEVQILIGSDTFTYTYHGNSKTVLQPFANPATTTPVAIVVKGRTVCNENSNPVDYGAFTTVNLNVAGNSAPVANDDTYSINAGYNSALVLTGSVLANDYDPDGDPIEVVAAAGATHQGGTYAINAAGIVTYTPPNSTFNGNDYFNYAIREVGGSVTVSARANINVGAATTGVFVKIVYRNTNGYHTEIWLDFFGDPAGTQPIDLTGKGIIVNYRHKREEQNYSSLETTINELLAANAIGTKIKIFEGMYTYGAYDPNLNSAGFFVEEFNVEPGTGYSPI